MAIILKVEIYIPLMNPDYPEHVDLKSAINDLCLLTGKHWVTYKGLKLANLKIESLSQKSKEIQELFKSKAKTFTYFLKFSTELKLNDQDEFKDPVGSVQYHTECYVNHLIIYLNLARPGTFDSREGVSIRTDKLHTNKKVIKNEFPMRVNSLINAIVIASKYSWPPIEKIDFHKTLNWLEKHWNSFETIPSSRIQRALSAFSYLFHEDFFGDNSELELFFALIGIEAIYVEGNDQILKQVDTKSQLLLGPRGAFKKMFNELYSYRSRFIHGQLNFTNRYATDDFTISNEIDKYKFKAYENKDFAVAILIASIQKHILLDKNEIEFEIIMKQ